MTSDRQELQTLDIPDSRGFKAVLAPQTPDRDLINAHGALKLMSARAGSPGMYAEAPPLAL